MNLAHRNFFSYELLFYWLIFLLDGCRRTRFFFFLSGPPEASTKPPTTIAADVADTFVSWSLSFSLCFCFSLCFSFSLCFCFCFAFLRSRFAFFLDEVGLFLYLVSGLLVSGLRPLVLGPSWEHGLQVFNAFSFSFVHSTKTSLQPR